MSTTQAGEILSVSDETIKRYLANGKLEGFKLPGGYYRIYEDSVQSLMRNGTAPCDHCGALIGQDHRIGPDGRRCPAGKV